MAIAAGIFDGAREEWDGYAAQHPDATFFHQYAWLEMVEQVYGGKPYYLAATEGGRLVGVLPLMLRRVLGAGKILVSVPFADEGGVIADNPEAELALLSEAGRLARELGAAYVELRQLKPIGSPKLLSDTSRVILRMPLPQSADDLWRSLSVNMRKKVRRARRDGLTWQIGGSAFSAGFYRVYAHNMRDLGSPMHSSRFFEALFATFPDSTFAAQVKHADEVAGAAVAVQFRDVLTVLCAHSHRSFHKLFPNNLLYWGLLEFSIQRGLSWADFGRSPRHTGIYEFKKLWGMVDYQLYRQLLPARTVPALGEIRESRAHRAFAFIWRRMPVGLARVLGPPLFSRLPI